MNPGSAASLQDLATVLRQVLEKTPKNEAKEGFECFFFDSETMDGLKKYNALGATHLEASAKHKKERRGIGRVIMAFSLLTVLATADQLPKNEVPKQAKSPMYILYADRSPEASRRTLNTVARISTGYWPGCFGFRSQNSEGLEKDNSVVCAFIDWLREVDEIEDAVPASQNVKPILWGRFDLSVIFEGPDTAR